LAQIKDTNPSEFFLVLILFSLEKRITTMATNEANKITGSKQDEKELSTAEEYWTEERRAAAIPIPLPKAPKEEHVTEKAPSTGEQGHVEPGFPPGHHERAEAALVGGKPVGNPLAYPYSTCGKLFFTQGGKNYSGSAAVVAPNVLLTAGHCVYSGGWSTNVAFYPSYPKRTSSDPAYKFSYSYLAAWTAWTSNGNRAFDYGMIWINNAPGNKVGWLGLLWNASTAGRIWDAVGYPATPNPPFSGNTMDEAIGTSAPGTVSGTIGLNNDNMEHGSSGGPWITDFNGSPRQYANGLQSFHVHDGDFVEYGPYFTADVKGLLDWISNPANRH
jgi:V8-like Glu-specific endopeptidase